MENLILSKEAIDIFYQALSDDLKREYAPKFGKVFEDYKEKLMNQNKELIYQGKGDPKIIIEKCFSIIDRKDGKIPLKLLDHQKVWIDSMFGSTHTGIVADRQTGLSTTAAAYVASRIPYMNNFNVAIFSNSERSSIHILDKINSNLNDLVEFGVNFKIVSKNRRGINFEDGSKIYIVRGLPDAEYEINNFANIDILIVDNSEYVFVDPKLNKIYNGLKKKSKQTISISTNETNIC